MMMLDLVVFARFGRHNIAHNVFGLAEVGEFEVQMFNLAQM
jgi:hypothetical protein